MDLTFDHDQITFLAVQLRERRPSAKQEASLEVASWIEMKKYVRGPVPDDARECMRRTLYQIVGYFRAAGVEPDVRSRGGGNWQPGDGLLISAPVPPGFDLACFTSCFNDRSEISFRVETDGRNDRRSAVDRHFVPPGAHLAISRTLTDITATLAQRAAQHQRAVEEHARAMRPKTLPDVRLEDLPPALRRMFEKDGTGLE